MRREQLAERIGNMDDRLVEGARSIPNYRKRHRLKLVSRLSACAAAVALLACSFSMGMLVYARQNPAAEEAVGAEIAELEDFGISMIVPDNWRGRYGVEKIAGDCYAVYSKETRESWNAYDEQALGGGDLCYVAKWGEPLSVERFLEGGDWDTAVPCEYIFSTEDATYLKYPVTDVQYTSETLGLYMQMTSETAQLRFVVSGEASARILIPSEAFAGTTAALVKKIEGDKITVDPVEYLTMADTERIAELGLTAEDLKDGYLIYNEREEEIVWNCGKAADYTFIDWDGKFSGSPYPGYYSTASLDEFRRYVDESYARPWPFFFKLEDGVVKHVLERAMM